MVEHTNEIELIEEMIKRYEDEWIFFEVTEEDEFGYPYKGILKAHHPDWDELHKLIMKNAWRGHFGVRYTGPLIPEGCEVLL